MTKFPILSGCRGARPVTWCSRRDIAVALLVQIAFVIAAYFFGRWQFERNLRFEEAAVRGLRNQAAVSRWEGLFRFPSRVFPDPTAAIMEKELRSLLRTTSFRLLFILGSCFGVILGLPHLLRKGVAQQPNFFSEHVRDFCRALRCFGVRASQLLQLFRVGTFSCSVWFSLPVPIVRTLIAKNLMAFVLSLFRFCW